MKKIFLFIALFAGSASLSQAQPRQMGTPEERAQRQMTMLEKQLNLTADQKAKIYTLVLSQTKVRDSVMTSLRNSGGDRQAVWSKMQDMQKENDQKISALLTDDQKKLYQQWVEERRSRMRNGQGGPRTGSPQNN